MRQREVTRQGTIYVVDDDRSVRRSLGRMLRVIGYRVETFEDPAAFLGHTPESTPCCAVLDVMMPGLSGLEVQQRMAELSSAIPLIFITAHSTVPMSVQAMKGGAVDFLEKPFEEKALLAAIEQALDRHCAVRASLKLREDFSAHEGTLTRREREVMGLVVKGFLNREIAQHLGIAVKTVKIHRQRMMKKMDAGSLAELVSMAEQAKRA